MTEAVPVQAYRGSLDKLIAKIDEARGLDLGLYRRAYLERRIAARLRVVGLHSYRQYADLLDADPREYEQLIDTLTINVTDFFRDKVVWDVVRRRVMPQLIAAKTEARSRNIRVWSAGCATGEEPYSLAMSLLDALGDKAADFSVSITATDLDPEALAKAERGVFRKERLRRIPSAYQVRFTKSIDADTFEVLPEVRRLVRFQRLSLFDPAPLRAIDMVFCRNVFIYFDHQQQGRVLDNFLTALTYGGYLVLGRSEKLQPAASKRFDVVDGKERIYRKPARGERDRTGE